MEKAYIHRNRRNQWRRHAHELIRFLFTNQIHDMKKLTATAATSINAGGLARN